MLNMKSMIEGALRLPKNSLNSNSRGSDSIDFFSHKAYFGFGEDLFHF